ncbi:MAG TPA: hypothetical protein VE981_19335 [Planctomycetota bacterium]|nr:hypothetical protein [Planctomycetota bacterium]
MPASCCDEFVRLHSNIGRRGFSIRTADSKATLHFNAIPPMDEQRLAEVLKPAKIVAQLVGRESIRFCPFCGAALGT